PARPLRHVHVGRRARRRADDHDGGGIDEGDGLMGFLPTVAGAFARIAGNDTRAVAHPIPSAVPAEVPIPSLKIAAPALRTLARHGEGSRDIVRKLHVDGLVGGELIAGRHGATLRIVIYDANGGLKSLNELPLSGHKLNKDELEVVRSNM